MGGIARAPLRHGGREKRFAVMLAGLSLIQPVPGQAQATNFTVAALSEPKRE